ncbi:hypothetical protein [Streptomyces sp. NPDC001165]|uniref:hypothetical protein n=1 Tax=Streptomyces sp. NPDC001165 TaxID=3364546 RepID=UPI00369855F5
MTEETKVFTADIAERAVRITWPDNDRGGATPPPDGWQDRAWAQEPTLHEIDEGSVSGCSVLRWREDPRSDAELIRASLALVTDKPQAARPAAEPRRDEIAALRVARSLAATLAAARERLSDIQPPKLARAALESLTAIHADLTAPEYDPREGTHLVLLLAFEDACQRYGVITAAERTTCATHRAHAADCCAIPLSDADQ